MRIAGIVAEYNPFHNGHAYLIEQLRDIRGTGGTHVVAVMSGNYVQRGEPALLPKEERVRMALAGGVDLVVELPVPYVLSSAEGFAGGAVALLDALGCVDVLGFGSECGDAEELAKVAAWLDKPEFLSRMRFHLEGGVSYAEARQKALRELTGRAADLLSGANNTLGIEYIRALSRLDSPMKPCTVSRRGAAHDAAAPTGSTASASYLRGLLAEGRLRGAEPYMPPEAFRILTEATAKGVCPADPAKAERALLYRLRSMSLEDMAALPGISEGLEHRLYKAARAAGSVAELTDMVKTRRYPATRIRRLLWAAYAGVTAEDKLNTPPYLRVLGLNHRGEEILAAAKAAGVYRQRGVSLLTRSPQIDALPTAAKRLFTRECAADDLYDLTLPTPRPCGSDYTAGMIRGE